MSGVAPGVNIVAVQVFSRFPADSHSCTKYGIYGLSCLLSFPTDQLAALEWVLNDSVTNNIAAINISIGVGKYYSACDNDILADTIIDLRNIGIATVIASGNSGYVNAVGSPGCISSAITVGSSEDSSDSISSFSNSSPLVDILAPGNLITSSNIGGGYISFYGTSFAAPHVTGAIAVIRGIKPDATVDEIEALINSGVPILDTRNGLTFPRLDLNTAVDYALNDYYAWLIPITYLNL
jgi:subtilisin family serine protease